MSKFFEYGIKVCFYGSLVYMVAYLFRDPLAYARDSKTGWFKALKVGAFLALVIFLMPSFEAAFSFIPRSWAQWSYDQERNVYFRDSLVGVISFATSYYLGKIVSDYMGYRKLKGTNRER